MGKKYQDKETLQRLYHEERMTQPEIADKFDINKSLVCYWMKKHGIEARANSDAQRKRMSTKPVPTKIHQGYRQWIDSYGEKKGWSRDRVFVHRLVAVAHYGFDAVCGMDVHHKNGYSFDNRPENLEPIDHGEHASLHIEQGDALGKYNRQRAEAD